MTPSSKHVARKVPQIVNPYEFDPDSPYLNQDRQTRFADFISSFDATPYFSPQPSYITTFEPQTQVRVGSASPRPMSFLVPTDDLGGQNLRRSDSSPSVLPQSFPTNSGKTRSPDVLCYYRSNELPDSPLVRSPGYSEDRARRGRQPGDENDRSSPSRQVFHTSFRSPDNRSPERRRRQRSVDRNNTGSPTRILEDVAERDENETATRPRERPLDTPMKRSRSPMKKIFGENGWLGGSPAEQAVPVKRVIERDEKLFPNPSPDLPSDTTPVRARSPMKKMFGEHGWLGNSPSEINEHKFRAHNLAEAAKQSGTRIKTTMMGKLKIKLEEMASLGKISR